ncbi:MAG: tRNA lysidine(34) synthetase TilS [Salinivirgaceae bacterium]|nr:tRNA lysidine(34) synthetase TilS [Salinivirgaceae bacterium]
MVSQIAFEKFIKQNRLFSQNDKILATVSGGADSVVLLHLLVKCGYNTQIAHCNFNLRNEESDGDEDFVRQLAKQYNVKLFCKSFNTKEYAAEHKLSIEMAARELRYNWFEQLSAENNFTRIATGHHLSDNIETLMLNLNRGTGINGITGIKPLVGNIARPLLFATRTEIEEFAKHNKLAFRTDSSNLSDDYQRNYIRHHIVPAFKQINKQFEQRMAQNLNNLSQAANIYNFYVEQAKLRMVKNINGKTIIDKQTLINEQFAETVLFEILSDYGFNNEQTKRILSLINGESGKLFFSNSHKLLIDRQYIIIEPTTNKTTNVQVEQIGTTKANGSTFEMQVVDIENFELIKLSNVACLDFEKIELPITIRSWQNGDTFYPLGMNKQQKLSNFFINNKINRLDKESALVLTSNNQIIWVAGYRPDNRFKITDTTKQVLVIKMY